MSVAVQNSQNRVMRVMICVSVLIHVIVLIRVADIYKKDAVSYIELSLQADAPPKGRSIPRPRKRMAVPETKKIKRIHSNTRVRKINPRQIQRSLSTTGDSLSVPDVPGIEGTGDFYSGGSNLFGAPEDYFEMVRLRIERHKKFPPQAKKMRQEGGVTLRFVITEDGMVSSLTITKESRHEILDRAALEAVRKAAPFPAPPGSLFKEKLHVEIRIVFELM